MFSERYNVLLLWRKSHTVTYFTERQSSPKDQWHVNRSMPKNQGDVYETVTETGKTDDSSNIEYTYRISEGGEGNQDNCHGLHTTDCFSPKNFKCNNNNQW